MATIVLAEITLPFVTSLPRDVAINATHWLTIAEPTEDDFDDIALEIDAFFNLAVDDPGQPIDGNSLSPYISEVVKRGENDCQIQFYDAQADPKILLGERSFTMGPPAATAASFPNELAACFSLIATPALPVLLRNRRGRLYFGPLNSAVGGSFTVGGVEYPGLSSDFRNTAAFVCERMASGPTLVRWAIYSRVLDQAFEVSGGFIDNEFDTQRRRQFRATLRSTWSAV